MAEVVHTPVTADNDPATVLGCTGCGWQPDFSRRDWRPSEVQYIAGHAHLNPDQRTAVLPERPRDESGLGHPEADDLEVEDEDEEEQDKVAWDLIILIVTLVIGAILAEVIWW